MTIELYPQLFSLSVFVMCACWGLKLLPLVFLLNSPLDFPGQSLLLNPELANLTSLS